MSTPHLLPVELLCMVFSSLPLKDRIQVTHVCHAWRSIALDATTDLWSQIKCRGHPDIVRARLERSKSSIVDLSIDLLPNDVDAVLDILAQHMHRVRSLTLTGSRMEDEGFYRRAEQFLMGVAAPALEFLDIIIPLVIDQPLFLGITPKLTFVRSSGRFLAKACHDTVTTVSMSTSEISLPSGIQQIFDMFPSVRTLELLAHEFESDTHILPLVTIPPHTQLVFACDYRLSLPQNVVDCIPLEHIREVEYKVFAYETSFEEFPYADEIESMIRPIRDNVLLTFEYAKNGQSAMVLTDYVSGFKRAFQVNTRTISQRFMNTIVALAIEDKDLYAWHTTEDMWWYDLELVHLTVLSIFVPHRQCYAIGDEWQSLLFAGSAVRPGPLSYAPRLGCLLISSHSLAEDLRMDPGTICDFIEHHLDFTERRPLPYLRLSGLPLLENRPEEVARMTRLAADIDYIRQGLKWESFISDYITQEEPEIDFS